MVINMNVGGTEKALLNMIEEMPEEAYDITILMLEKYGGFLDSIPDRVQVKYVQGYAKLKNLYNDPPKKTVLNLFRRGDVLGGGRFAVTIVLSKILKNNGIFFRYMLKHVPDIKNEYDIAVAYAGPMDFISYFIINKVNAERKIQWIHFDITKIGFNQSFAAKIYNKFDQIFVVSQDGKNKLMQRLPNLKTKVDTFTNVLSSKKLLEMASKGVGFEDHYSGTRILTVGRLSKEKGQDLVIPVLAKLKAKGFNVRWYCIGEGSSRREYEKLIKAYHVENDFILLGERTNPYPFMKQCDIYVQPSRHEGYCITLAEARCFDKPIVSTKFAGVNEHIIHGKTGLIVNFDQEEIGDAIIRFITCEGLMNELDVNLRNKVVGAHQ